MKKLSVLVYGDIGGSGGYVRYCKGLFGSNATPDDVKITFVCSPEFYEKLAPLDSQVEVIIHPWISSPSRLLRYAWHLWIYPRLAMRIRPHIEFFPAGNRRVYFRKALTVTTCHNLLLFDQKELEKVDDKNEYDYFRAASIRQSRSFQASNGVIFLSDYSKLFVCKQISGISDSTVISHGLDPGFIVKYDRSYQFNKSVNVLYISPIYQYKHQTEVVKAIGIVRKWTGIDINLKLIGGCNSSAFLDLNKVIQLENLDEYVHLVDGMRYEDLLDEYKAADIFVFASSCETFGITLLEAMGAKLPIACSDRTGLPDILKEAGKYFDPEDPQSIANALTVLINSLQARRELGTKAFCYAHDYTWSKCAGRTFDFIKEVYGANSR